MSIKLSIESMTTEEKIQTMEALWQDLCEHADELTSPGWHGDVLAEREQTLAEGADQVIDWETAKEEIPATSYLRFDTASGLA